MSSINASTGNGITYTSDNTSTLQLQTGGLTAANVDASQNVTFLANVSVIGNVNSAGNINATGNLVLTGNVSATGTVTVNNLAGNTMTLGGIPVASLNTVYVYTLAIG